MILAQTIIVDSYFHNRPSVPNISRDFSLPLAIKMHGRPFFFPGHPHREYYTTVLSDNNMKILPVLLLAGSLL